MNEFPKIAKRSSYNRINLLNERNKMKTFNENIF